MKILCAVMIVVACIAMIVSYVHSVRPLEAAEPHNYDAP